VSSASDPPPDRATRPDQPVERPDPATRPDGRTSADRATRPDQSVERPDPEARPGGATRRATQRPGPAGEVEGGGGTVNRGAEPGAIDTGAGSDDGGAVSADGGSGSTSVGSGAGAGAGRAGGRAGAGVAGAGGAGGRAGSGVAGAGGAGGRAGSGVAGAGSRSAGEGTGSGSGAPGVAATPPTPPPPTKPPRSALGMRELITALLVLVPMVLLLGGLARGCTFDPGGPTADPTSGPTVDAPAALRELAPRVPFGLRIPDLPPGWRSNSVDQGLVDGGGRSVRVGFLTDEVRFLRLVQSDAAEGVLLLSEVGGVPPARGTTDAGGQQWVVYGDDVSEPVWVAETVQADGTAVRLLITGSGDEDDFVALATATLDAEALPPGTAPG
jgi:hypothetical protein